ncbi:hypothetical protein GGF46_005372 [Coemansia sp. RSA 552]|nr:hypothetical protein GGF46_005372 [Coemansia sp. RSA 552]
MQASMPYTQARLRSEPIAELCGVVAGNRPVRSAQTPATVPGVLPKQKQKQSGFSSPLRRTASLLGRSLASDSSAKHKKQQQQQLHERTLEILRTILASAKPAVAVTDSQSQDAEKTSTSGWVASLDEKRSAFVEALRELQHPHAEGIEAIHALLCNRACLGLLSADAAGDFAGRPAVAADDLDLSLALDSTAESPTVSLSSSLGSEESAATLDGDADEDSPAEETGLGGRVIEMWASSGRWGGAAGGGRRGRSICSERTLVAGEGTRAGCGAADDAQAEPDDMGVCWPLDAAAKEAAGSWGRFYADLGEARVPTRFRVPQHSLSMLASEQLMMRNDKIVCPLKNRLQEVNPRRQCFEDFVRATGTIPPPATDARPRSSLCNEVEL